MSRYRYEGPVMEYGRLLVDRWKGETVAPSEQKARNNLAYQFKKNNRLVAGAKISLPGKIKMVG